MRNFLKKITFTHILLIAIIALLLSIHQRLADMDVDIGYIDGINNENYDMLRGIENKLRK